MPENGKIYFAMKPSRMTPVIQSMAVSIKIII
jgi:hypothetical protein